LFAFGRTFPSYAHKNHLSPSVERGCSEAGPLALPQRQVHSGDRVRVARNFLVDGSVGRAKGQWLDPADVGVVTEDSRPRRFADFGKLAWLEGAGLATHIVEESISLLDLGELIPNHAEEGPAEEARLHGPLRHSPDEEINVVHVGVDLGEDIDDGLWNGVRKVLESPGPGSLADLTDVVVGGDGVVSSTVDVQAHEVHAEVAAWGLEEMVGEGVRDERIEFLDWLLGEGPSEVVDVLWILLEDVRRVEVVSKFQIFRAAVGIEESEFALDQRVTKAEGRCCKFVGLLRVHIGQVIVAVAGKLRTYAERVHEL